MTNTPPNDESNQDNISEFSGELAFLNTPLRRLIYPESKHGSTPGSGDGNGERPPASANETALTLPLSEDGLLMGEQAGEPALGGPTNEDPSGDAERADTPNASDESDESSEKGWQESKRANAGQRGRTAEEDYSSIGLRQRRAEDERTTGRRWPGNGIVYPGSAAEAQFFDQLAIAFGEAEPTTLARETALRYVRSSRAPGEDELSPTDIYSIVYYGLGLTVRPLDCTGLPQALALYHRATRDVYVDWKLLQDPPFGRVTLDPSAWRRSVDGSAPARFLLAWCAAVHLTDNYDLPLMLGFTPHEAGVPSSLMERGPAVPPDTLNRYSKAVTALTSLLAPEERLWRQIATLELPLRLRPGDSQWRDRLRASYGYVPAHASETRTDPATQLIATLAERNNCPPLLIEAQLDHTHQPLDWGNWSVRLLHEIPELQLRFASAARMFHLSAAAGERDTGQGASEVRPIHIRLSL